MMIKNAIIVFVSTILFTACGGGGSTSGAEDSTTAVENSTTSEVRQAGWTITLNANCADRGVGSAEVFVDGQNVGILFPGNTINALVEPGEHQLEAVADNGATLGPVRRVIEENGLRTVLNCDDPGDSTPSGARQAEWTITLNATCAESDIRSADIFVDGQNIGTLVPGNSTTTVVDTGERMLEAVADNGRRVGPLRYVIEENGLRTLLNCNN